MSCLFSVLILTIVTDFGHNYDLFKQEYMHEQTIITVYVADVYCYAMLLSQPKLSPVTHLGQVYNIFISDHIPTCVVASIIIALSVQYAYIKRERTYMYFSTLQSVENNIAMHFFSTQLCQNVLLSFYESMMCRGPQRRKQVTKQISTQGGKNKDHISVVWIS